MPRAAGRILALAAATTSTVLMAGCGIDIGGGAAASKAPPPTEQSRAGDPIVDPCTLFGPQDYEPMYEPGLHGAIDEIVRANADGFVDCSTRFTLAPGFNWGFSSAPGAFDAATEEFEGTEQELEVGDRAVMSVDDDGNLDLVAESDGQTFRMYAGNPFPAIDNVRPDAELVTELLSRFVEVAAGRIADQPVALPRTCPDTASAPVSDLVGAVVLARGRTSGFGAAACSYQGARGQELTIDYYYIDEATYDYESELFGANAIDPPPGVAKDYVGSAITGANWYGLFPDLRRGAGLEIAVEFDPERGAFRGNADRIRAQVLRLVDVYLARNEPG